MKKVIVTILLIVTFFNLIHPIISYATDNSQTDSEAKYGEFLNSISSETREIKSGGITRAEVLFVGLGLGNVEANVLANIVNIIAIIVSSTLFAFTSDMTGTSFFTIYDLIFNKIDVFDVNYLLNNGNTNTIHTKIQEQVTIWYGAIRKIAIILSLCVLIYIGIRMAISTLSEDKAKYKKMFMGWLQSFILIFFMHYIILFSMIVASAVLKLMINSNLVSNSVETSIYINTYKATVTSTGWNLVKDAIAYWILVFYQIKFFFLYAKRTLSVALLIIISPLITVTYPIDKAGDGKAQAFDAWIREFEVNIFIQPLHALIYLLFFVSTSEILLRVPILTAIFLMGLSRGEKVVKGLFSARGMKSISSMGKGKKKK